MKLVPQPFSRAVSEAGKGFYLEGERQSWCCPKMPYERSLPLPLSRERGGTELV